MASRGDIDISTVQPKLFSKWKKLNIEETLDKAGLFTKLKSSQYFDNGQFPVIDQGDKFISGYVNDEKLLYKGSLPVIIFGDHTRNIKFIDFPFAAGADGTKILKPLGIYNPKFYHYYLKSLQVPNLGYSRHFSILKEIEFPLPPFTEQNRIVAKLDSLFAQLESIKTSMAKMPVLLKNFRQQVLTQAVTGKLTEEWREGKDLDDWEEKRIDEMSSSRLGKMLDKAKNIGEEFEYLGNIDVQWNKINVYNLKKVRIEEKEFTKFLIEKGDILVCEGGEAGRAAIWEKENSKIIYQKALHRIRVYNEYHPKFLLFNLELDTKSGEISKLYTGTTIKHLTGQNLAKYKVNYPPFKEQQEIVSRVESLFVKADAIEEKYKNLKAKIETLPQTILHKAFKGELSEQLESDGDARVLLEEIAALKMKRK